MGNGTLILTLIFWKKKKRHFLEPSCMPGAPQDKCHLLLPMSRMTGADSPIYRIKRVSVWERQCSFSRCP